jgi:hypothetical protein
LPNGSVLEIGNSEIRYTPVSTLFTFCYARQTRNSGGKVYLRCKSRVLPRRKLKGPGNIGCMDDMQRQRERILDKRSKKCPHLCYERTCRVGDRLPIGHVGGMEYAGTERRRSGRPGRRVL